MTKKRYGSKWRKIRNRYINNNPLCEECLKDGKFTKAEEVHHILPLRRGGNHDESNLMALCKSCHSRISVLDGAIATIMALDRAIRNGNINEESVYDNRGLLFM